MPKLLILFAILSAKSVRDVPAEFDKWGQGLRITAQDVPEVDMEEAAVRRQHEVVMMTVTNAQDVGNDAVSSAATDVVV